MSYAPSPTRVVHKRHRHDVYIGRPSKWGNPFKIGELHPVRRTRMTRADVIELFRIGLTNPNHPAIFLSYRRRFEIMRESLDELQGVILGCWCKPQACHGDVLAEFANKLDTLDEREAA